MECPACNAANDADSLFCESCGSALERSCGSCSATSKASARFCRKCGQAFEAPAADEPEAATRPPERPHRDYTPRHLAEKILATKSALEGERKQVTVLFADVKSSMQLSEELDPEEWHAILERFFEILSAGIHRFEGTVNQYTGDGIMALFGAPLAHEDHAQRACYAALYLRDALKAYTDELRVSRALNFSVRMGINSGEVVVGKIGDDLRMDYTAQGHTVGLAQRMESLAEPGKALLAGSTIDLVEGYFALRDLGETAVKGVEQPVRVAELEGIGAVRTRLDRSRARGLSKFVGRQEEIARLESSLERALAGDGQVVGVVAEAGSGKSRLCYEFLESCRARGITVRATTGVPHGKAVPLEPILLFYREIFGIEADDDDAQARQKIAGSIAQGSSEELEFLPLLYEFMRVPDPDQPALSTDPERRDHEIMQLLRRLTVARSRREPAVLVFEDLHWVDPQTDAVIEWIVDAASATRTLVLANFRPEYRAKWMSRTHYQQIALRPLDAEAAGELLGEWLGPDPSLEGFPELVRDRTGGNPFFMEEVLQSQIESGALTGVRGSFKLEHPIESLEVPASVQSLLAARIDLLEEETKRLLQTAAVIGDEVPDSLLLQVTTLDSDALRGKLRDLVQAEFLFEASLYPSLEYAFKHPLTREVGYGSLLRDRRRTIHSEVAKALEASAASESVGEVALLAYHWEQAGRRFEAARWQSVAAERLGISRASESLFHWSKVIELLEGADDIPGASTLRGQARARVIYAASRSARSQEEVVELFDAARRELGDADSRESVQTLLSYSLARGGAGFGEEARAIISEAIEMSRRLGDRELLVAALGNACVVESPWEFPERVIVLADEVEEICAEDPSLGRSVTGGPPVVMARVMRIMACASLGRGREIAPLLAHLRSSTEGSMDPLERTVVSWVSSQIHSSRGEVAEALEESRQALEWAGRSSNAAFTSIANFTRGQALLAAERAEEALPHLERSLALALEGSVNSTSGPIILAIMCKSHLALGTVEPARLAAERAVALAKELGLRRAHAVALLSLAEVCIARGADALPEASSTLERVASILSEMPESNLHVELALGRADLAGARSDPESREAALREAIRLHCEAGEDAQAERVEQLL